MMSEIIRYKIPGRPCRSVILLVVCILQTLCQGCSDESSDSVSTNEKQESISARVVLGGATFSIPLKYIRTPGSTWVENDGRKSVGINLFLPNFGGFDQTNYKDPFNPDRIKCSVTDEDERENIDVHDAVDRLVAAGSIKRDPKQDRFGLAAYMPSSGDIWTYIGTGTHGNAMNFRCWPRSDNDMCQVEYRHVSRRYWVVCEYRFDNLSNWHEIDDSLNQKLDSWRMPAES